MIYSGNKIPGPSDYDSLASLSGVGKYLVSNQKGGTKAKFDKNGRKTHFDEAMKASMSKPGPGAYRSSS